VEKENEEKEAKIHSKNERRGARMSKRSKEVKTFG